MDENGKSELPHGTPDKIEQLWIIEAPGKRNILKKSLSDIYNDPQKKYIEGEKAKTFVFATKGYLLAMSESMVQVGIDRDLHDYGRKPKNPDIYSNLLELAQRSDAIIVATDSDREGDVIAYDIYQAVKEINLNIARVRLQAMDAISVKNALEHIKEIDKEDAIAGRTRALIDRAIGSAFLKEDNIGVGRVSSALMGIIRDGGLSKGTLTLVAPDSDGEHSWACEVEIRHPLTLSIAEKLSKETFPALEKLRSQPLYFEPDNAGEVMLKANKIMGLTPKQTAEAMQRNYESGRLSYPRSHSKGFSRFAAKRLAEDFQSFRGVTAKAVPSMKNSETHEALHAVGSVNIAADPNKMGVDEGVRTLIGRGVIKCLQSHIRDYADPKPIEDYLRENGYREPVIQYMIKSPWFRDIGPQYPGKVSHKRKGINRHSKEYMLLDACIHFGLGRSSSWPGLIETMNERDVIDPDGVLSEKGEHIIQQIPKELTDYRTSVKIDNICENASAILSKIAVPPNKEPWEHLAKEIIDRLPSSLSDKITSSLVNEVDSTLEVSDADYS